MTRQEALVKLLALRDEPCMRRGYVYKLPRDPRRDPEIIKRDLGTAYVTWRRQEHGKDISCVVSVRRQMRMLKRQA